MPCNLYDCKHAYFHGKMPLPGMYKIDRNVEMTKILRKRHNSFAFCRIIYYIPRTLNAFKVHGAQRSKIIKKKELFIVIF